MMVQNFQKRLMKVYKSKEYLKYLMITQQNLIKYLKLEYLETTKLMTELDTKYSKKFNLT